MQQGTRKAVCALGLTMSVAAFTALGLAGCSLQQSGETTSLNRVGEDAAASGQQYAQPVVKTLDDGTQVQRTPDDGEVLTLLDGSAVTNFPKEAPPFNSEYLDADARGCGACHEDLGQLLADMDYKHVDMINSLGIETTVQMCIDCHDFGPGYQASQHTFGELMHMIHKDQRAVDCWSCHTATDGQNDMKLWDEEKHKVLRGITPVADVTGAFSFSQDRMQPGGEHFEANWYAYDGDFTRMARTESGEPLDESMFDEWTITISGNVDQEKTFTLPELIEQFESEQVAYTQHCTYNPTGGPLIGTSYFTAIPLSKVFAACGMKADTAAFTSSSSDGFTQTAKIGVDSEAYLAYEIDGERLPWRQGYPVRVIVPGKGAPSSVLEVCDIVVNNAEEAGDLYEWNGWPNESGTGAYYTPEGWPFDDSNGYVNKPNVGLFDFKEGQVIRTGEPYTFTGYAHAWDKLVTGMEYSMDGGVTWTHFDTPSIDKNVWVNWSFTFTPEIDSAYVLAIRSVAEDGTTTPEPIEVLFNAKTQ